MLFYPSHDIALGNGVKHFNPPLAALRLQEDLAALSKIWNEDKAIGNSCEEPVIHIPWGWDWDTRAYICKEYGIKQKYLPTDEDLSALRELSSRKTTISIISKIKEMADCFRDVEIPTYLDNEEKLTEFIDNHSNYVLKTPWSSSGRGLSRSEVWAKESLKKHALATIRKMGGIVAEKWYQKIQDFAMLFYVGKEKVEFIGYSLFDNDEAGTYRSGKLMSNDMIEAALPPTCEQTKQCLLKILNEMFEPFFYKTWEVGYLGIDMMIAEGEDYFVHPCVEMNLRCTMGVVARLYFDQNCTEEQIGDFFISPASTYEKLHETDINLSSTYGERYKRLTYLHHDSMFMAYAIFE